MARFLTSLWRRIVEHRLVDLAAQLAFFALLALFPFVILLSTLIGLVPVAGLEEQIRAVVVAVAPTVAVPLLDAAVRGAARGSSGGLALVGLAGTLLAASRGISALTAALNHAYEVVDRRGRVVRKLRAIGITAAAAVLVIVAASALLIGPGVVEDVATRFGLTRAIPWAWRLLRWPATLTAMAILLGFLYHACPAVDQRFRLFTAGSLVAVPLWLAASVGFDALVTRIGSYNRTYGALAAGVVLLLWLQLSGLIVLVGGEINALRAGRAARPA